MTVAEARTIKAGQRVVWESDAARGTVREVSYASLKIEWDDGKWALMPFAGDNVPFEQLHKLPGSFLLGSGGAPAPL